MCICHGWRRHKSFAIALISLGLTLGNIFVGFGKLGIMTGREFTNVHSFLALPEIIILIVIFVNN